MPPGRPGVQAACSRCLAFPLADPAIAIAKPACDDTAPLPNIAPYHINNR